MPMSPRDIYLGAASVKPQILTEVICLLKNHSVNFTLSRDKILYAMLVIYTLQIATGANPNMINPW